MATTSPPCSISTHINRQLVQRTSSAPTSMTQVMTDAEGQRTFFHSPGANRLLDLPAF